MVMIEVEFGLWEIIFEFGNVVFLIKWRIIICIYYVSFLVYVGGYIEFLLFVFIVCL